MNEEFDICIIGAGMAGATIAAYLAPQGIKIALIDRSFSEKNRIVGELLQPGAVETLSQMGFGHLLEGIDGQHVFGYALLHEKESVAIPYNRDTSTRYHGMGLHNGRFLQKIREAALENTSIIKFEGTATELIENQKGVITGVKYKEKTTRVSKHVNAKLTITSDGFFSHFRKALSNNKKSVTSFFVGLVLTDCSLPFSNFGHVFLSGSTPFLCYPISSNEVRLLIDFPGDIAPKRPFITNYLKNNIAPYIPDNMKDCFVQAVSEGCFKIMPNHYMAAKPVFKPGAVLLGDALNMRHPLTGGGITAVFSDVKILGTHLLNMPNFNDNKLIDQKVQMYYKDRKNANTNVNILANALYEVMSNDSLKHSVFHYINRGGKCAFEPISILAGLNRNPNMLIKHFIAVVFCGVKDLLKGGITNFPKALRMLWDATKIIKPLAKNELSLAAILGFNRHKH